MNGFHKFIKQPLNERKIRMLDLCKHIYIIVCTPELCYEPNNNVIHRNTLFQLNTERKLETKI